MDDPKPTGRNVHEAAKHVAAMTDEQVHLYAVRDPDIFRDVARALSTGGWPLDFVHTPDCSIQDSEFGCCSCGAWKAQGNLEAKAGGVEDGEATRGWVTWLSSGEDEGPDCGIMLGLGGGKVLLAGELAKITVEASGVDSARFPDEWWIAVHHATETEVIAAVADQDAARNFIEMIAKALAPAPEPLRVAEHKCFECTSELSGPICLTCNPLASSVRVAGEEVERLQDAIEGECDGLAITEAQAKAILDHVALIEPSAGRFLADLDAAFDVEIEKVSTLAMNSNTIAREFYRRLRARV